MAMKPTREQTATISVSTILSILGSLGTVWAFAAPIAAQAVKDQIQKEIAPMMAAQIITISATVRNLQKAIVSLEFKRDMCGGTPGCWTIRDAEDLTSVRNDLRAAEDALKALAQ